MKIKLVRNLILTCHLVMLLLYNVPRAYIWGEQKGALLKVNAPHLSGKY
jgi:hypothetical protein